MTAISNLVATMAGWIVAAIAATGYFGIIGLMALESACIPLPSEIIMPFSGYLVSTGRLDLWLVAIAGAVGCNLGSALAYEAGRHGGRPMVERYGAGSCSHLRILTDRNGFSNALACGCSDRSECCQAFARLSRYPRGSPACRCCAFTSTRYRVTALVLRFGLCRRGAWKPLEHGPAIVGLVFTRLTWFCWGDHAGGNMVCVASP